MVFKIQSCIGLEKTKWLFLPVKNQTGSSIINKKVQSYNIPYSDLHCFNNTPPLKKIPLNNEQKCQIFRSWNRIWIQNWVFSGIHILFGELNTRNNGPVWTPENWHWIDFLCCDLNISQPSPLFSYNLSMGDIPKTDMSLGPEYCTSLLFRSPLNCEFRDLIIS